MQLMIGAVPRESIDYDKTTTSLLKDKKYGCNKCPGLIFEKTTSTTGRSLEKHLATVHKGEHMNDLSVSALSNYRLRRKNKKRPAEAQVEEEEADAENQDENEGRETEQGRESTQYEYEMHFLKRGNPYRMNPYDTSVPVKIEEEIEQVESVYPDPEKYSI